MHFKTTARASLGERSETFGFRTHVETREHTEKKRDLRCPTGLYFGSPPLPTVEPSINQFKIEAHRHKWGEAAGLSLEWGVRDKCAPIQMSLLPEYRRKVESRPISHLAVYPRVSCMERFEDAYEFTAHKNKEAQHHC